MKEAARILADLRSDLWPAFHELRDYGVTIR